MSTWNAEGFCGSRMCGILFSPRGRRLRSRGSCYVVGFCKSFHITSMTSTTSTTSSTSTISITSTTRCKLQMPCEWDAVSDPELLCCSPAKWALSRNKSTWTLKNLSKNPIERCEIEIKRKTMKSDDVDGYLQVESLPFGEIINKASPVNIPHIRACLARRIINVCTAMIHILPCCQQRKREVWQYDREAIWWSI